MFRKILSVVMIGLIINLTGANLSYASTKDEKRQRFVEKVKDGIRSLGTGEQARVEVKLLNKSKYRGYVKESGQDAFTVVDEKTGAETGIAYAQVKQVKGKGMSTGKKIAIGIGIGVAAMAALAVFMVYVYGGD